MAFLVALQFLTAIPVRIEAEITPRTMGRAMTWFPIVGLILGGILAGADLLFRLVFPETVGAALLLATWVAITGALHLDGFMDCCDGLLVAKPPERRLEILRDTHAGSFAVTGAVCLLLVKYAALLALPAGIRVAALVAIPALSRAQMVFAAKAYRYARPGPGLGRLFREGLTWSQTAIAIAISAVAISIALGWTGVAVAAGAWLLTVVIAWLVQRRIPGLTGDVYGAINELVEVAALLALIAIGGPA